MWLAVRGCVSDWCNSVCLIAVCSEHMVLNELSLSSPSPKAFPGLSSCSAEHRCGKWQRFQAEVAWGAADPLGLPGDDVSVLLCSGAVLLYFNLTSGSAKPKVQDLIHCLSMESVLAVMEEHALFPHHFLLFCVFARTQMLLLLLGNESPEHFFSCE